MTLLEFGDGVTMGRPSNHSPEGTNRPSEGQKSMSDRLGASQEQSKSPEDVHFRVFFGKISKNLEKCEAQERPEGTQERPRGAQERPKGAPRASRRVPRGLSRRSGELSGTILTLASSKKERSENDQ